MKTFLKCSSLFCSVLATLSLAAGLNQFASKIDPVAQKAQSISTFDTGDQAAPLPCMPCTDPE